MKTWQEILNGESQPSGVIEEEIKTLTSSGQELQASLPGLLKSLEEARKSLLAEVPGSLEKVKEAEMEISENKNKLAGLSSVLEDLNMALQEALSAEKAKRQREIIAEVAAIDEQASKKRDELVTAYARACALYVEITSREFHNLDYHYFVNYNLEKMLRESIQELLPGGPSLLRQRQILTDESTRLERQ